MWTLFVGKKKNPTFDTKNIMKYVITLLICLFTTSLSSAQNTDIEWLRKINLDRNKNLDGVFSSFSSSVLPISAAYPLTLISVGLATKNKKLRYQGYTAAAGLTLNLAATAALKYSIQRPRPYETYPDLTNTTSESDPSFPSGHSSTAFYTATSLSLSFPKWYVIAPSFLWAGASAYSRLHAGVHYPSDVAIGIVLGAGTAILSHHINKWYWKKVRK